MKKIEQLLAVGMLFLSIALPLCHADDNGTNASTNPSMNGTPQEMAELQKTLASEQVDTLQQNLADLRETVNTLTERVSDLERTVYDDSERP